MQVTIQAAESQLEKLIDAARAGEEVIIANGDKPIAKLVPITQLNFKFDMWKGKIAPPPDDFFDPLSEEEQALWDGDV
jgi:antitoxin (DNA-binding transcriptional repressor) of toxin-antitoxin stability system